MVKCGSQTMNKAFSSLGYKVFGVPQVPAFAAALDDYGIKPFATSTKNIYLGTNKIGFAEMAKQIWEDNEYDVIIEPSALYWREMAQLRCPG